MPSRRNFIGGIVAGAAGIIGSAISRRTEGFEGIKVEETEESTINIDSCSHLDTNGCKVVPFGGTKERPKKFVMISTPCTKESAEAFDRAVFEKGTRQLNQPTFKGEPIVWNFDPIGHMESKYGSNWRELCTHAEFLSMYTGGEYF
jgi:hypothetical protein